MFSTAAILPFLDKPARRLAGRRLPPNVRAKTKTFSGRSVIHALRQVMLSRNPPGAFRESMRFSETLGRAMVHRGFCNATHLYSMLGECGPLLVAAKQRGLTVVSEIYIPLSAERIVAEERKKFPDWEPDTPDFAAIRREIGGEDVLLTHTDFAICPSEPVRTDLVKNFGFPHERTAIVPYGVNPELLSTTNLPVRGRVLFAGTANLRKGIHYFAMAAEKLVERGFRYEFRVAGNVQPSVSAKCQCRHLRFLGRVARAEMQREFAAADVFALPSLAEGAPEANLEALASGVPVVTTSEARAIVRDGIVGRIVPSRDPEALAGAISEIIEDREKRKCMSQAARKRAQDYTWERYGERLLSALKVCGTGVVCNVP